jgi:CRISPR-associated protein Cmr1
METIEATYRVATPMFLGGAEQQAELRLPSFKGMLRFWWRASVWPRIAAQGGSLSQLRQREARLFGSSDEAVGRSKISLRFQTGSRIPAVTQVGAQLKDGNAVVGHGSRYLGYGVMNGQLTRSCLQAPFSFCLNMLPRLTEAQREEVLLTLKVVGLLGSLGSKARKGYGSLTLVRLAVAGKEIWEPPSTENDLQDCFAKLLEQILPGGGGPSNTTADPRFTAFSAATRILIVPAKEATATPMKLLDHVGREMVRYRSYGHNGRILGNEPRENPFTFQKDHDLMKQPASQRSSHPERIAFGLPHNYGKEDHKQVNPAGNGLDRRASPLFLHIHQASESAPPIGILCFMPATFLPEGNSGIFVGGKRVPLNTGEFWKPIEGFLDRFRDGKTKEPFGKALEVKLG